MAAYFFAGGGNDGSTGTSSGAAFQTINKLNAITPTLHSGDVVSFNKGDTFYGSFIAVPGVTYTSYGTGAQPIISGFDILSSWTSIGGGIYYCTDTNLGATVRNVTINGAQATLGRFPKTGYRPYTGHNGNLSITDLTLPDSPSYVGAQIVITKNHYVIDAGTITGQASGVISYTGTSTQNPISNYGYFLQNSPAFLTQLGEWSYDASTHRVYMYFGANDPNSYVVKASRYDIVIDYSEKAGCVTTNLCIEGGNTFGIKGHNSHNSIFNLCTILNSGYDGFALPASNGVTVTNMTIGHCYNNGIIVLPTIGSTISNNNIDNCGNVPGRMRNGFGFTGYDLGTAISLGTNDPTLNSNNTVSGNRVTNCGYTGIYANGGSYTVSGNYVDTVCTVKDDGGAIYTWAGPTPFVYALRTISGNIVLNSIGRLNGIAGGTDGAFGNEGNGIYADENSSNLIISGNTIAHCGNWGIILHNNHEVTATGNTIFDADQSQLAIISDSQLPVNLTVNNNIMISRISSQMLMQMKSRYATASSADLTHWGIGQSNQYGALHTNPNLFVTQIGNLLNTTNFNTWKTTTGQDGSSVFTDLSAYASKYLFLYNNTNTSASTSLSGVYKDIFGTSYSGSITLNPFKSAIIFQVSTISAPNISYSPNTKTFIINQAITPVAPINSGGAVTSYSINPALPSGLNFDTVSGVISGASNVLSTSTNYTVVGTNATGSSTTTINITVNTQAPAITYSFLTNVYTLGVGIASLNPVNTGGTPSSYSISPSLPLGLSFNTSTGVISGIPGALSNATNYTITATNVTGSATSTISIAVKPRVPAFSYSPSSNSYIINVAIPILSPINTGGIPVSYSISPSLPSGLSFNTSNGSISGTPTVTHSLTTYTITATNTGGNSTATVSIAVVNPPAITKKKRIRFI